MIKTKLILVDNSGIIKTKSTNLQIINRRICYIAHALISAARPRLFISSLLLAITTYINQNFESKEFITILSSLSFSESYTELQRFHDAILSSSKPCYDLSDFIQYVFDNADFNIFTLTGHGTFHSLGGLVCSTPSKSLSKEPLTRSLKTTPNKNFTSIMVKKHTKRAKVGLPSITVEPIELMYDEFKRNQRHLTTRVMDLQWLCSFGRELSPVPSWSGFMQVANKTGEFERTKIQILNPNDMSTIYTALSFVQKLCDQHIIAAAPVTFD